MKLSIIALSLFVFGQAYAGDAETFEGLTKALHGDPQTFNKLLTELNDINYAAADGQTLLMLAVASSPANPAFVRAILARNPNTNLRDSQRRSALDRVGPLFLRSSSIIRDLILTHQGAQERAGAPAAAAAAPAMNVVQPSAAEVAALLDVRTLLNRISSSVPYLGDDGIHARLVLAELFIHGRIPASAGITVKVILDLLEHVILLRSPLSRWAEFCWLYLLTTGQFEAEKARASAGLLLAIRARHIVQPAPDFEALLRRVDASNASPSSDAMNARLQLTDLYIEQRVPITFGVNAPYVARLLMTVITRHPNALYRDRARNYFAYLVFSGRLIQTWERQLGAFYLLHLTAMPVAWAYATLALRREASVVQRAAAPAPAAVAAAARAAPAAPQATPAPAAFVMPTPRAPAPPALTDLPPAGLIAPSPRAATPMSAAASALIFLGLAGMSGGAGAGAGPAGSK